MRRREFITLLSGAAAAWPLAARAQQPAMPVIGFLSSARAESFASFATSFRQGLNEAGYVEGQNLAIEYRWAEDQHDRLPALAAELVSRKVAVILGSGGAKPALAVKAATANIPVVFVIGADPIKVGLVASLNRPGVNITGVSFFASALGPKRLELLRELVPGVQKFGFLANPNNPNFKPDSAEMETAARSIGKQLLSLHASTEREIEAAFAKMVQQGVGAAITNADTFFVSRREYIVALAERHAIPVSYELREFVVAGGLMSYGASIRDAYRQSGNYVGRILNGTKPSDLPVMLPSRFELVINLNTAKALGLTVPPTLLTTADEVIE
jgi:putative ABC transport system substrate-binding protein